MRHSLCSFARANRAKLIHNTPSAAPGSHPPPPAPPAPVSPQDPQQNPPIAGLPLVSDSPLPFSGMPPLEELPDVFSAPSPAGALNQHGFLVDQPSHPGTSIPNPSFSSSSRSTHSGLSSSDKSNMGNSKGSSISSVGGQESSNKSIVGNSKGSGKSNAGSPVSSNKSNLGNSRSSSKFNAVF